MNTSSSIPAKRPRTGSSEQATKPPVITRCEELWYKDGSIVIEAENTQFRVYQGILAAQSEAFEYMFAIPQPPSGQDESVEGCPLVKVSDTAKDWTFVLRALIARSYITVGSRPLPFDVVAAFLRLGEKYNITILKTDALTRLQYEFPSTLEQYDQANEWSMIENKHAVTRDTINLAREVHCVDYILPSAFHALCCENVHKAILEATRDDGSKSLLSPEDQVIVITGWAKGRDFQRRVSMRWLLSEEELPPLYEYCMTSPLSCIHARGRLIRSMGHLDAVPPIAALWNWEYLPEEKDKMCKSCLDVAEFSHTRGREAFWDNLPSFFGLPEWPELLKES